MADPAIVGNGHNARGLLGVFGLAEIVDLSSPLLQGQAAYVREAQGALANWIKRRQGAFDAGIDAFHRLTACKEPAAVVDIGREVFTSAIDRLIAEMQTAREGSAGVGTA